MRSCKNCAYFIFNTKCGEIRCTQRFIAGVINNVNVARKCKFYKKRKEETK